MIWFAAIGPIVGLATGLVVGFVFAAEGSRLIYNRKMDRIRAHVDDLSKIVRDLQTVEASRRQILEEAFENLEGQIQ